MGTGNMLVMVICVIILAIFIVGIIEMTIPLFKKIEINDIGDRYMSIMEVHGGLTLTQRNELEAELTSKGFDNVTISYSQVGTVKYGEVVTLKIDTTYEYRTFGDLTSLKHTLEIDFQDEFTYKRIEN